MRVRLGRSFFFFRPVFFLMRERWENPQVGAGPTWDGHTGREEEEEGTVSVTFNGLSNLVKIFFFKWGRQIW